MFSPKDPDGYTLRSTWRLQPPHKCKDHGTATLMSPQTSDLLRAVNNPPYPEDLCSKASEIQPIGRPHHHSSGYSVTSNYFSPSNNLVFSWELLPQPVRHFHRLYCTRRCNSNSMPPLLSKPTPLWQVFLTKFGFSDWLFPSWLQWIPPMNAFIHIM